MDKRDRGLNLALPIYQFKAQNRTVIGGAKDLLFNIHALPGIWTWNLVDLCVYIYNISRSFIFLDLIFFNNSEMLPFQT